MYLFSVGVLTQQDRDGGRNSPVPACPTLTRVTDHAGVVQITTFSTDGDRWAQLIASLHQMSEQARGTEGCFGAQVCSDEDRPDAVAVVSRWRSRTDLDGWLSQGGESATAAAEELAGGPAAMQTLTSLSPQ